MRGELVCWCAQLLVWLGMTVCLFVSLCVCRCVCVCCCVCRCVCVAVCVAVWLCGCVAMWLCGCVVATWLWLWCVSRPGAREATAYVINGLESNIAAGSGLRMIRWLRHNELCT